ncbi:MAG: hypothetical protein RLN89_11845 [Parvibaculum sp.]
MRWRYVLSILFILGGIATIIRHDWVMSYRGVGEVIGGGIATISFGGLIPFFIWAIVHRLDSRKSSLYAGWTLGLGLVFVYFAYQGLRIESQHLN